MKDLFPYDTLRKGQDSFIKVVRTAINYRKDVLAQVPTGVGKTAAVLSATLNYAIDNNKKIIFLTSKHTHHKIAIDTLREIKDKHNIKLQVADFIGKVHMCGRTDIDPQNAPNFPDFCRHLIENKDCEYYENFHNKSKFFQNKSLFEQLKNNIYHVEELIDKCREKGVCPYEATNMIAKESDVIVADYFHMLDSGMRDSFLKKIKKELKDCIIIWDEAHNIPGRAMDLMSSSTSTISLTNARKEALQVDEDLADEIVEIELKLNSLAKKYKSEENLVSKQDFGKFSSTTIDKLNVKAEIILEKKQHSYLRGLARFLSSWNIEGNEFTRVLRNKKTRNDKKITILEKNCLDPATTMSEVIAGAHSNIFMSGTLYPLEMFEDLFGLELPLKVEYQNPFPKENRIDMVVPGVSTKYTERNEKMYTKIGQYLSNIIEMIPNNKIVFFPSYNMIDKIKPSLSLVDNVLIEESGMTKTKKEEILEKMRKSTNNTLLAVSAGSFGESINLEGDALTGVIIVGIPFAKFDLMSKELVNYYDNKFGRGQEYGYTIPAFIKVLQNAGRCIRSETDRGSIIYLDERYGWSIYSKYFPKSTMPRSGGSSNDLEEFFNSDSK
ncbi:ATP-dependent DNA helicase [archaeon]|jgi:DNA excision repair protein ERCC-2|nr:ATP-dependent DNA helicase [archaeon]MBT6824350.1 ATP-dependent DNA helicase [archaeon]MBT7106900.1 ATP-dependent DNA helicase [archaeon]MBT7297453.1 ATP-dependent DNA helicase [archaeon]